MFSLAFLAIAFGAGVLTVLAPCILPLLPVVVGGSISGERSTKRAVTVVASLGASVLVFTLALKATTAFIAVPAVFWNLLSGGLLIAFGLVTAFPSLWENLGFTALINRKANAAMSKGFAEKSFWGDVLVGVALGPVFTSCSPTYFILLATVLPAHPAVGFVYLLAYTIGLSIALLLIALVGQKIVDRLGIASDPHAWFKRAIGALFIIVGLLVVTGLDRKIAASLPAGAYGVSSVEQKILEFVVGMDDTRKNMTAPQEHMLGEAPTSTSAVSSAEVTSAIAEKSRTYDRAPELVSPDGYVNTGDMPITLAQYRGKSVVLLDFWDYSCINCQRTTPYLNAWYKKYKDQGLIIVGVHTPEFSFEQLKPNVEAAAKAAGIEYPVTLDNQYQTWNAYHNSFWPHEYLIDIDGFIVHDHIGEGGYDETEHAIQKALAERVARLGTGSVATSTVNVPPPDLSGIGSPETYFGSGRNEYLGNGSAGVSGVQDFTLPGAYAPNMLYLGGEWNMNSEYAETDGPADVVYRFNSREAYFVAESAVPVTVQVYLDGKLVGSAAGADVGKDGTAVIQESRLYKLVKNPVPGEHVLKLHIEGKGLKAYTFTFG